MGGGGKSDGVIGDWISHEEQYGQDAIGLAFRRERTQLVELIERARAILSPLGYKWHEQDKYFRGPKGGRLRFSYLESDSDADAYQGHSYTRLYPEEMGTFPNERPINKLQATLRSGNGVPCQMKGTCNPGGPGHQWVKARYQLYGKPRDVIRCPDFEFVNPFTKKKVIKRRVFIPSRVSDNKFLGDDYVANIAMSGNEKLVQAWLEGDWDAVEGAFFDCWDQDRHVIEPFEIPPHWLRFVAMDWGFAAPFSIGWWAVASDQVVTSAGVALSAGIARQEGANGIPKGGNTIPRGALVCYREWYGTGGARLTAEQIAKGILEREAHAKERRTSIDGDVIGNPNATISYGVLDPSAFDVSRGPSIAEQLARSGAVFRRADNRRVRQGGSISGWDQMRGRLVGDNDGHAMMLCFSTCKDSIRTIPVMQHDPDKYEDMQEGEDHCFAGSTLVDTDLGPRNIAAVWKQPGIYRVWSAGAWRSDFTTTTRMDADLVRLTFDDGRVVVCTPDHKFMDFSNEWRYAADLLNGDVACDQSLSVQRFRNFKGSVTTFADAIFSARENGFTSLSGERTMAASLSRPNITSIIGMTTVPATESKIWNASQYKNISAGVTARRAAREAVLALKPQEMLHARGIVLPLVGNGTRTITKEISERFTQNEWIRSVIAAGASIKSIVLIFSEADFVQVPVAPVRCVAVERQAKSRVYCLNVPETRAFTIEGGLVVHNCADQWRYACMSRPWTRQLPVKPDPRMLIAGEGNTLTLEDAFSTQRLDDGRI